MSGSAKGTAENPGKNVKAKSGLNKAILDQGWGLFKTMLAYKLSWNGGALLLVPPKNTSRRCPVCGFTHEANRKSQAVFICINCGYAANADINGAVNIKEKGLLQYAQAFELVAAGHAVFACGGSGPAAPAKQEPINVAKQLLLESQGFSLVEDVNCPSAKSSVSSISQSDSSAEDIIRLS